MADEVPDFWNNNAENYNRVDRSGLSHHTITAEKLHAELKGAVLCVGGLWVAADVALPEVAITVADVSQNMLDHYASSYGVGTLLSDARSLEIADNRFDHVVLPLIIHHVTGKNGRESQAYAQQVIREAARVLKPGGKIWIKEILVSRPVYVLEIMAAPMTRWLLARKGVPLVIFHDRELYQNGLSSAGFSDISFFQSGSETEKWFDLIRPVIGIPKLIVPRFFIPVRYELISARLA